MYLDLRAPPSESGGAEWECEIAPKDKHPHA